jgi:hypothetical protein
MHNYAPHTPPRHAALRLPIRHFTLLGSQAVVTAIPN